MTIVKTSTSYFACASSATTAASFIELLVPALYLTAVFRALHGFISNQGEFRLAVSEILKESHVVRIVQGLMFYSIIPQVQPCFPPRQQSTWSKQSSRAEQSRGIRPPFQPSHPSGVLMQKRNFPPTRKSILQTGAVKPFGPHHCITYFGSVHAFQTNSRGASKTLVTTIRSVSLTVFLSSLTSSFFICFTTYFQLVETLFPESAIANRPVADCLNRLWPKRAHTLSSTLRLDHNPRPHQVGDMF